MEYLFIIKQFFSVRFLKTDIRPFHFPKVLIWIFIGLYLFSSVLIRDVWAQKEVTSKIYRYQGREKSTRRYEKYEVKPRLYLPHIDRRRPRTELVTLAPTAERVRFRKYLADAHVGLRFYQRRTCIRCHPSQARSLHSIRAKISCRQCHGDEPIPGNNHYNAPMHPRRRYAFICAKCHAGSSPSFATYRVHEPSPLSFETLKTFPVLFYVFWSMVVLAVGTFVVFLPHTLMWGIRELLPPTFRLRFRRIFPGKKKNDSD